jgi:hypothetical protein
MGQPNSRCVLTISAAPLEDIERIEAIREPGGQLTQGGLVTVGGGNEKRVFTVMQYGGTIGQDVMFAPTGKSSIET